MQTAVWILLGVALGAGCGCGALIWAHKMLKSRGRKESVAPSACLVCVIAAAVCGGVIGFCTGQWLPMTASLAILTTSFATAISDWLCRIIPNPTVLVVFAVKLFLVAAALLHIPGAPSMEILSSLGGMATCFLLFSAPGLMGKQVGAGDIKLATAMGFLLGFNGALVAVAIMGILILGYSIVQQKIPMLAFLKTNIPMGPFIAAGMMIAFMVPYLPL